MSQDTFRSLCEKWAVLLAVMRSEPAVSSVEISIDEEADGRQVCTIVVAGHPRRGLTLLMPENDGMDANKV
jgi:hypothetical protein